MGIKSQRSVRDAIMRQFLEKKDRFDQAVYMRLRRVGLQFVRDARQKADFTDRTGNLRSSIGFVVIYNGKIKHEDFEQSSRGTDKSKGIRLGKREIENIVYENQIGWVLIVVAGMQYAMAVESRGYDVISNSSWEASVNMADNIRDLQNKINGLSINSAF